MFWENVQARHLFRDMVKNIVLLEDGDFERINFDALNEANLLRIIELENELKKKDEIIEKQRRKKIVYKREMERYRRKLTRIYDEFRSQITGEDSVLFDFLKHV